MYVTVYMWKEHVYVHVIYLSRKMKRVNAGAAQSITHSAYCLFIGKIDETGKQMT